MFRIYSAAKETLPLQSYSARGYKLSVCLCVCVHLLHMFTNLLGDYCFTTGVKKFSQNNLMHFQQRFIARDSREFVNSVVHSISG